MDGLALRARLFVITQKSDVKSLDRKDDGLAATLLRRSDEWLLTYRFD